MALHNSRLRHMRDKALGVAVQAKRHANVQRREVLELHVWLRPAPPPPSQAPEAQPIDRMSFRQRRSMRAAR